MNEEQVQKLFKILEDELEKLQEIDSKYEKLFSNTLQEGEEVMMNQGMIEERQKRKATENKHKVEDDEKAEELLGLLDDI